MVTLGSTTGVSAHDDRELSAGSACRSNHAGQGDEELFVIESQASELRRSHRISELAIRTLGAVFQWLAVWPAAIGLVSVVQLLSGAENSLLAGLLGEWSRGGLLPRGGNEFSRLLLPVGLPVLSGWLCFRLGSSLKHHSPSARWMAVFLLAAACVPPLTLVFQAFLGPSADGGRDVRDCRCHPREFSALVLSASVLMLFHRRIQDRCCRPVCETPSRSDDALGCTRRCGHRVRLGHRPAQQGVSVPECRRQAADRRL